MDPFEKLPEEIYDHILRYFEIDEFLFTLSQVSVRWYEVVGKSSVCMQKIRINLRSKRKNDFEERIETLKWMSRKNSRKYQSMQANCLYDESVSCEFYNFLRSATSLESISMRSMKLVERTQELEPLSLPKLEFLKVMFIPRDVINMLLTSSTSLMRLVLWNETPLSYDDLNYQPNETSIESARWCLANNLSLTELEIQGRANFFAFFERDIAPHAQCKLKKLTVKVEMKPQLWTEAHETNFIKFLAAQSDTLEYIYIDSCPSSIIKYVFNSMPNLRSIRFDIQQSEPNRVNVTEFEVNEKIESFELPYVAVFDDLKDFLQLLPNLQHILVGHVIPRLMSFVTSNLPQLKTLVYRYDDCAGGCEQLYKNMMAENPEANQNIALSVCNDFL